MQEVRGQTRGQGVVWQEPAEERRAAADLVRMSSMGINTVRTPPVRSSAVRQLADTLGIRFYQELPIRRLPARRLRDTVEYAQRELSELLQSSRSHPSARTFGLARNSDTSDSTACRYFSHLAELVRRAGGADARVYYVTQFIEDDVCGHAVDFVLIDALGSANPVSLLERWRTAHPDVPVGVAAVGTWVDSDASMGVNVPGSRESQARYLERTLAALLRHEGLQEALFVYRWRDIEPGFPSPAYDLENPYRHTFGLYTRDGQERPAADVVAGIYGRGQTVFAFPSGPTARSDYAVSTLMGWLVLLILAVAYAASPRLRPMVPRYFFAHGFYREAVREGRDVLVAASAVLLAALALAVGLIWIVAFDSWRTSTPFLLVYQLLPQPVEEFIINLLARPVLFLVLIAGIYAIAITLWSSLLAFMSRRRYPLSPAQAIMLSIWPRWPVLLLMLAAMGIATLPREIAFQSSLYLVGAWVLVMLMSTGRTLFDYYAITKVPPSRLVIAILLNPMVLLMAWLAILALGHQPEITFLWHAITRT